MTNGVPMKTYAVKIEANKPFDESLISIPEDIVFLQIGDGFPKFRKFSFSNYSSRFNIDNFICMFYC